MHPGVLAEALRSRLSLSGLGRCGKLDNFNCGEAVLDDLLKRRALANQASGASRTFVVTGEGARVSGPYAMAAGALSHQLATSRMRRNVPDPVPVMVLARLAVDRVAQGQQPARPCCRTPSIAPWPISERRGQSPVRAFTARTGQTVLRAVRLRALADASTDTDAASGRRKG
jgi:hypothetical protein